MAVIASLQKCYDLLKTSYSRTKMLASLLVLSKHNVLVELDSILPFEKKPWDNLNSRAQFKFSEDRITILVKKLVLVVFNNLGKKYNIFMCSKVVLEVLGSLGKLIETESFLKIQLELMICLSMAGTTSTVCQSLNGKQKLFLDYVNTLLFKEKIKEENLIELLLYKLSERFFVDQDCQKFELLSFLNKTFDFLQLSQYTLKNYEINSHTKGNIFCGCADILFSKVSSTHRSSAFKLVNSVMRFYGETCIFENYNNFSTAKFLIVCITQSFVEIQMAYYFYRHGSKEEMILATFRDVTYFNSKIIQNLSMLKSATNLPVDGESMLRIVHSLENVLQVVTDFISTAVIEVDLSKKILLESLHLVLVWISNNTEIIQIELKVLIPLVMKLLLIKEKEMKKYRLQRTEWMLQLMPWLTEVLHDREMRIILISHHCLEMCFVILQIVLHSQYQIKILEQQNIELGCNKCLLELIMKFASFERNYFSKVIVHTNVKNIEKKLVFLSQKWCEFGSTELAKLCLPLLQMLYPFNKNRMSKNISTSKCAEKSNKVGVKSQCL